MSPVHLSMYFMDKYETLHCKSLYIIYTRVAIRIKDKKLQN